MRLDTKTWSVLEEDIMRGTGNLVKLCSLSYAITSLVMGNSTLLACLQLSSSPIGQTLKTCVLFGEYVF